MMSDTEDSVTAVSVEDHDRSIVITLHPRPDGTLGVDHLERLSTALRTVDHARHRAVLIVSDGPDLCAGLAEEDVTRSVRPRLQRAATGLLMRLQQLEVAIIVAARGRVSGFGCSLLLAGDVRILADDIRVDGREPATGSPGVGVAWLADRVGGAGLGSALLVTPAPLDGERIRMLATTVTDAADIDSTARTLMAAIVDGPSAAATAVRSLRRTPRLSLGDALRYDALLLEVAEAAGGDMRGRTP